MMQVCAPWATPSDLCFVGGGTADDCVDGVAPLVYVWTPEEMILAVSNLLYVRTGFRYPGVCEYEVWPCIDGCYSEHHECVRCRTLSIVALPTEFPVVSIVEITEDDVVLPASAYRLGRRGRIIRLDGRQWARNSFGLDCADAVETIVTYTAGLMPPIELRMAVAALTDELLKSCNGQACALPAQVTSFARRGVSVELTDLAELLKTGATGIPIVDHALAAHTQFAHTPSMSDPAHRRRGAPVVP